MAYLIPLYFRGTLISRFSRFEKNRENLVPQKLSDAKICMRENYVTKHIYTKPFSCSFYTCMIVLIDIFLVVFLNIFCVKFFKYFFCSVVKITIHRLLII